MAVTSSSPIDVEAEIALDTQRDAGATAPESRAPWNRNPRQRLVLPQSYIDQLTAEGLLPPEPPAVLVGDVRRVDLQRARDVAIDREARRLEERGGYTWAAFDGAPVQSAPPQPSGITTTTSLAAPRAPESCYKCGKVGFLVVDGHGRKHCLLEPGEIVAARSLKFRRLHRRKLSPDRRKSTLTVSERKARRNAQARARYEAARARKAAKASASQG